jgi:hypothetical protein
MRYGCHAAMTVIVTPSKPARAPASRKPLRRLFLDLAVIVVAKIALLMLIWYVAIRPVPRPDTRPNAIERVLAPSADTSPPSPSPEPSP